MFSITAIAQALGLTGLFASRVFLPMFAAALMMRFGPQVGLIDDLGLLGTVTGEGPPTWFTHDITLLVLGVLAGAELLAHKSPEARELLNLVDQYGKPVAALLTYLGIASVADRVFIEDVVTQAGFGDVLVGLFVAGGAWLVGSAHNAVFADLLEADEDDDTGVVKLVSWAQDIWSTFGMFFLILFPAVMLVLILITIGIIFLLERRAEAREEKAKTPCPNCSEPMYRSALACPKCGQANPAPADLSWAGTAADRPAPSPECHALNLAAKRRCRRCANHLPQRTPRQACPACGTRTFDDPGFVASYERMIAARLPLVLAVCALLSLVPVIGLIPGVVYYRMALVGPYRRYIGRGRAMLMRWGMRVVFVVLIMFQWVPIVGGLVVPTMALISYGVYRRAFGEMMRGGS